MKKVKYFIIVLSIVIVCCTACNKNNSAEIREVENFISEHLSESTHMEQLEPFPGMSKEGIMYVSGVFNNEDISLSVYYVAIPDYSKEIKYIMALSNYQRKIIGFDIFRHNEIEGKTLLDAPEFCEQFVNISFNEVDTAINLVADSSAESTLTAVKNSVKRVISLHIKEILEPIETKRELADIAEIIEDNVSDISNVQIIDKNEFDKDALDDIGIQYMYQIDSQYGYIDLFYVKTKGYSSDIKYLLALSEYEIVGFKVFSHYEILGGSLLDSYEFAEQFENLDFSSVDSNVNLVGGSTATETLNVIKNSVKGVINFYMINVLGIDPNAVNLNKPELMILNLPNGYHMVNKTESYQSILKSNTTNDEYEQIMEKSGILNYAEILDDSDKIVGYAYIAEKDYIAFEGIYQNHKIVFMFDANWENSKLVVVSSSDAMNCSDAYINGPDFDSINPTLINNKWLAQFQNLKMSDFCSLYSNDSLPFDNITGATYTSNSLQEMIMEISKAHSIAFK